MSKGLARRMTIDALARRSPAYRWLHQNYSGISEVVGVHGIWTEILAAAIAAGVTVKGGEPSRHDLYEAWRRVKADMGDVKPKQKKPIRTQQPESIRGTSHVQPGRPGTFNFDSRPKETDRVRLWGKRKE